LLFCPSLIQSQCILLCASDTTISANGNGDYVIPLSAILEYSDCPGPFTIEIIAGAQVIASGPPPVTVPGSYGGQSFTATITDSFGASCTGTVDLVCSSLGCVSDFDLSPNPNGTYTLQLSDILDPQSNCPGPYSLEIRTTSNQLVASGPFSAFLIPASYVGQTLSVTVTDDSNGASCTGLATLLEPPCQDTPTNQHVDMRNGGATEFTWNPISQSRQCEMEVREFRTGRIFGTISNGQEPSVALLSNSLFQRNWVYGWKVRCTCEFTPLQQTQWSRTQVFRYILGTYR